jgi:hypothetical protein
VDWIERVGDFWCEHPISREQKEFSEGCFAAAAAPIKAHRVLSDVDHSGKRS